MTERTLERPLEELQAGDTFRKSLVPRCDRGSANGPLWHGWAIMDAFLAGIDYSRDALDAKSALLAEAVTALEIIGEGKSILCADTKSYARSILRKIKAANAKPAPQPEGHGAG